MTKEKFMRYEEVRRSGMFNMVMDARYAMKSAMLSEYDYWDIIKNYSEYKKRWL